MISSMYGYVMNALGLCVSTVALEVARALVNGDTFFVCIPQFVIFHL